MMHMVLFIDNFHVEQNVRQRLRHRDLRVTFDHDFGAVIRACAGPRGQRMGPGLSLPSRAYPFRGSWIAPVLSLVAFSALP